MEDVPVFAILAVCLALAAVLLRAHRNQARLLRLDGYGIVVVGVIAAFSTDSTGPSIAGVAFALVGIWVLVWARKVKSRTEPPSPVV